MRETVKDKALVGPSIRITGGLAGEEDVLIQGSVDGTVEFKGYSVTIGKHGRVKADVFAREICIEGELEGNIVAEERVELRASGKMKGNIQAPRVMMQDGALFKGGIDMTARVAKETSQHTDALSKLPQAARDVVPDKAANVPQAKVGR